MLKHYGCLKCFCFLICSRAKSKEDVETEDSSSDSSSSSSSDESSESEDEKKKIRQMKVAKVTKRKTSSQQPAAAAPKTNLDLLLSLDEDISTTEMASNSTLGLLTPSMGSGLLTASTSNSTVWEFGQFHTWS